MGDAIVRVDDDHRDRQRTEQLGETGATEA